MSSDDEIVMEAVPGSDLSSPVQQASPNSIRGSKSKGSKRSGVGEFRGVEESIRVNSSQGSTGSHRRQSSDDIDHFTGNAARQRKSEALTAGHAPGSINHDSKPEVLESVEVPVPKKVARKAESPPLQGQFIAVDGTHRSFDMQGSPESPDELQGEKTIHPVVSSVLRSPRKEEDMRQRSSPSDIQPTQFTSRSNGRLKSRKQALFDAVYLRFQDRVWPRPGDKVVTIRVNPANGIVEIENADDPGNPEKIYIDQIVHVVQGDGTSRNVALQFERNGDFVNRMDIVLSSEEDKMGLCNALGKPVKEKDRYVTWHC